MLQRAGLNTCPQRYLPEPYEDLLYAILEVSVRDLIRGERKKKKGIPLNEDEIEAEVFFTSGDAFGIFGDIADKIYWRIVEDEDYKKM